jgi:hypothetical protein
MAPPARPKIYHFLHIDRLPSIIADGCLWCDAVMVARQGTGTTIGLGRIKQRRLILPVTCHSGTRVGDYVPFYFCSRSIMLFMIYRANDPGSPIEEDSSPSFTWRPIFIGLSRGRRQTSAAGRSRCRMPERSILGSDRA